MRRLAVLMLMMSLKTHLIRVYPVLILAWLLAPAPTAAQISQRLVERATRLLAVPEPLEIVEVVVGGRAVSIGQPFEADEDWLKSLTIKARNISQLPVTYVEFRLEIMPSGPGERIPLLLKYGSLPVGSPAAAEAAVRAAEVKPGEFFQLSLGERLYDHVLKSQSAGGRKVSLKGRR
jgi:hypothetical protein